MHGLLVWMAQGTAIVAGMIFILWLLHFPLHNAAIADVGWSIGLALLAPKQRQRLSQIPAIDLAIHSVVPELPLDR